MKTKNNHTASFVRIRGRCSRALMFACLSIFLLGCQNDPAFYGNADDFVEEALAEVQGISVEEAKSIFDTASYYVLLDVREPEEYKPGYIPDAINLPRGLVEFKICDEKFWENKIRYLPEKSDLILVYCKKGTRAILAANTLQKMGFENVRFIFGGFKKWEMKYPNDYNFVPVEAQEHAVEETGGC